MKLDKVIFYSSQVYISEDNSNPDSYIAKFIICDFGRNENGVALNRETIENWINTLNNKPLVGKIKVQYDGSYDFTSHNMKVVNKIDDEGKSYQEVEFDSDAFGSFFDVSIENINGEDVIVASCEIWKRFSKACEIILKRIQEGNLHTSWEIAVEKSHHGIINGAMTKIIDAGRFIGHCLLGANVTPAYNSSGLLEIASKDYDVEFAEALSQDILSQELKDDNTEKEEIDLGNTNNETKSSIENIHLSALTERDLRFKIMDAAIGKLDKWCWVAFHFPIEKEVWIEVDGRKSELDYVRMTYEVVDDEIVLSEPEDVVLTVSIKDINMTVSSYENKVTEYENTIAEKDELIIQASSEITNLKSENTALAQYKEKFNEMEQEKLEAELSEKKENLISSIVSSGQITREEIETSEELQNYVNNLDKKSLMAIVGERLLASVINDDNDIEISEKKSNVQVASDLNNDDDEVIDKASIMRKFLRK